MQRVRQSRTTAEDRVAEVLRLHGFHYRRNVRSLPGSPDFANRRYRWAIFVNGCYWHHHKGCRRATIPKRNREFWIAKFAANRHRDAQKIKILRRAGFRVVVIWECEAFSNVVGQGLEKLMVREPASIQAGNSMDH